MSTDIYEPWQNVNNDDITHSGIITINCLAGGEREKSYSELEAENVALRQRVEELEAQLDLPTSRSVGAGAGYHVVGRKDTETR